MNHLPAEFFEELDYQEGRLRYLPKFVPCCENCKYENEEKRAEPCEFCRYNPRLDDFFQRKEAEKT